MSAGKKRKSPEPSSTSSASPGINHEVFLNFRGEDTRKFFADLLHKRLKDLGITVFKDDYNLRAGDELDQALKDAIERSKISIAIFSKEYASSTSCLMEVVQMWDRGKSNGQIIIPIFYDVTPDNVKHQTGDFAKSFKTHEEDDKVRPDINTWKEVLQKVGKLVGFERENINSGHVTDLLDKVVTRVWQELKRDDQAVTDKLVGIAPHVQEMMIKLGVVYSHGQATKVCGEDIRVVGICGMRGVGKTTLARVVYNKIHMLFDGRCSFVEYKNLRGVSDPKEILEGVIPFQKKLISELQKENCLLGSYGDGTRIIGSLFSNMKVLIVLDDVHKVEQIEGLVGDLTWFGSGSRIIVTTDDTNVFNGFIDKKFREAVIKHKVEPLIYHQALQLFRKHAFQGNAPQDVSEHESRIVKAAGGLPLAIEVTGSFLCNNSKLEGIWEETSKFLGRDQEEPVKAALENSYKYLDEGTQAIFLDIACFFDGEDERIPSYMWKACAYCPARGIKRLRDRCLLDIGENKKLKMHALLRDFGRKRVNSKDLSQRCRFWNLSDARSILEDGMPNAIVQGISLPVEEAGTVSFTFAELGKKSNLRYLRLDGASMEKKSKNLFPNLLADIFRKSEILLPNLRWLGSRECHFIPELGNMDLKELVILNLSKSPVTNSQVWRQIMEKVKELKVLNLQGCDLSRASLKFSASIKLEILILEDCTHSSELGTFIRKLERLKSLNLRNCEGVKQLAQPLPGMKYLTELLIDGTDIEKIHIQDNSLENLEILSACDCKELKDISTIGRLRNLTSLALDGANINWDPATFEFPPNLQRLSLRSCSVFNELPPSIEKLGRLQEMDLSLTGIKEMPPSVKHLSNLKTLKMEGTPLQNFPEDIVNLGKLEEIDFSGCTSLEGQDSCDISGLSSLRILRLTSSIVAGLPNCICRLPRLQTLDILKCDRLHALPKLPSSLLSLRWGSKNMTVPDLSYLTNLKELCLRDDEQPEAGSSNQTPNIEWITGLTSLETLELSLPNVPNLPGNFSALTQLRELSLSYMKELDLTQLPSSSLWTLRLKHCKSPEPKFSGLKHLSELELEDCDLAEIDGLKDLKLLEVLKIFPRSRITDLNELKGLPRLRKVKGDFSAPPRLPKLSERVEQDIYPEA